MSKKTQDDFDEYLSRFAKCRGITKEEASKHYIVKEYALMLYLKERGKL